MGVWHDKDMTKSVWNGLIIRTQTGQKQQEKCVVRPTWNIKYHNTVIKQWIKFSITPKELESTYSNEQLLLRQNCFCCVCTLGF